MKRNKQGQFKAKPAGQALFNRIYRKYQRDAKRRNISFALTQKEFKKLINQQCFYCQIEPQEHKIQYNKKITFYRYNGLDRLNNKAGYTLNNIVACCTTCNFAKGKLSYQDWIAWLNRIKQFWNINNELFC